MCYDYLRGDKMLFIEYPTCSTCIRAKKFLKSLTSDFTSRHIVNEAPTKEELREWLTLSQLPIQKFFNTSGLVYKQENYKEKLKTMSEDEKLDALSKNGKLIKRPLLVGKQHVLVGYSEEAYKQFIEDEAYE